MAQILHILTKPADELAAKIIGQQKAAHEVEIIDLTTPEPDYDELLDKIFEADSVQVW